MAYTRKGAGVLLVHTVTMIVLLRHIVEAHNFKEGMAEELSGRLAE